MGLIGQAVKRVEDARLVTGAGRYVADLSRPHMLHAVVIRSPHAHAHIRGIATGRARAMPGVVDVITFDDVRDHARPIPMRLGVRDALTPHLQMPLARDVVRYVGEPVAVLVAVDRYAAEDACEAVEVDYNPLPAAIDPDAAPSGEDWTITVGDVDDAFRGAAHVVRERFYVHRHTGVPLETRGLLAEFDRGRRTLTVWGPTKVPYFNRRVLAGMLRLEEDQVRFIEGDVGGGFGVRGEFYPEDFLVPFLAVRTGRPVRWIEERREHFLTANHSREQRWDVTVAARADGTLIGFDVRLVSDMGAYIRTHGALVAENSAAQFPGPYRVPSFRCRITCAMTNKTPVGTYRAPAVYGSAFARERIMDLLAARLGLDPAELRARNLVRPEDMPYSVGTQNSGAPVVYHHGAFPQILRQTLEKVGWAQMRQRFAALNADESSLRYGLGFACILELSRFGPFESARVEVSPTGRVNVYTGATSLGQGHETTLAQVCADALAVPFHDITVHHGDTADLPYAMGTYASRFGVAAAAVYEAASEVKAKILAASAELLEVDESDLVMKDGRVSVVGMPERGCTVRELARATSPVPPRPGAPAGPLASRAGTLQALHLFKVQRPAVSFSVHMAVVTVDTRTGLVTPQRYIIGCDVGRIVNPTIVEGQLVGGVAQGIAGALAEELVYAENGQLLTATLMDYALPNANDVPAMDVVPYEGEAESPGVQGVHGVGELATAGAGAAVASAVADALRGRAADVTSLPLKPPAILSLLHHHREGTP
jgi:CO/xanthine dehydrogenase Mo-binding subunit